MNIPIDLVKQAKESLGVQAAEIIASGLSLNKWDSRNLKGCCPVHSEKTPSFTWNKKKNAFKCFGCGATLDIVDYYIHYCNMSFLEACKKLFAETHINYEFETIEPKKEYKYPTAEKNTELNSVQAYMKTRQISIETLNKCGIKQDNKGNIVYEYKDQHGELLLVKYRPSRKIVKGENKLWCQKDKDTTPLLFCMDKIDTSKPLLITEGENDCLSCVEAGFNNTVSVPFGAGNFSWIEHNWEWLEQFEKIIIWADNDESGQKMKNEVIPRLGEYRCYVVNSQWKDANIHLFKEGKESTLKAIESAKDVPIKDVIDLYDVGEFDINKAEKIRSGFNGLDKFISGFVLGSLDIVTGINSSGKSTLLNQMCISEPLQQGYKTFIYSAELQKEQLKSWIQFPLAGPDNVQVFNNGPNQPEGYFVSKEIKSKISEWYKGKIFLYNNEDDNTAKNILSKMEELAKKYGVKNFILDNLMMIDIDSNGYDDLKKQKEFVLTLKRFSRRYKAIVHLVAHPRKVEMIKRLSKLDVAGSGDITNLADYVIAIHRVLPSEKEGTKNKKGNYIVAPCEYDNILDLFKNRHTSYQDKAIGLYFDMGSKRMHGDSDDLNKKYNWENEEGLQEVIYGEFPF